jgi:hypothetical protein
MNAKGSKSARTPKTPKTPAEGGKPDVMLGNATTAVLPNPADAPSPKGGRKRKGPEMVVDVVVPPWVRNTEAGPPLANAVETAPASADAAPALKPKRGRPATPAKPAKSKDATPPAPPGSLRAIGEGWLGSLKTAGHTPSTISSYATDLALAYQHFGDARAAGEIPEKQVATFDASPLVTKKKNGKGKATPTILKTRRALRLALVWAEKKKLIKKAPFAVKTPA